MTLEDVKHRKTGVWVCKATLSRFSSWFPPHKAYETQLVLWNGSWTTWKMSPACVVAGTHYSHPLFPPWEVRTPPVTAGGLHFSVKTSGFQNKPPMLMHMLIHPWKAPYNMSCFACSDLMRSRHRMRDADVTRSAFSRKNSTPPLWHSLNWKLITPDSWLGRRWLG